MGLGKSDRLARRGVLGVWERLLDLVSDPGGTVLRLPVGVGLGDVRRLLPTFGLRVVKRRAGLERRRLGAGEYR